MILRYASNAAAIAHQVTGMATRARDVRPVLADLGDRMVEESIPQNFKEGGRPDAWEGTRRGGTIQRDTSRLLDSIESEVAGATLRAGTNLAYAPQRHHGGEIKATNKSLAIPLSGPGRPRRPSAYGKRLRWAPGKPGKSYGPDFRGFLVEKTGKGKRTRYQYRFILLRRVEQPPRPFLLFQPEDIAYAERQMVQHLTVGRFANTADPRSTPWVQE